MSEWKKWALDTYVKEENMTYAKVCGLVNDKFELNINVNTFRREMGQFKKELIDIESKRFELLRELNKDVKPLLCDSNEAYNSDGQLVEVFIADLHIGKACCENETGEFYNYQVAEKIINDFLQQLKLDIKSIKVEKFLLPVGNDLLNFDDTKGNTTLGTPQDNDIKWQKMFTVAVDVMAIVVSELLKIAPVHIMYVAGNHDKASSFYLCRVLEAKFGNFSHVSFDNGFSKRKYFEYGNNLIGFTHGETEKNRIYGLMQIEADKAWGRTKYREFHMGHLHSESVEEVNGIKFRRIPSLSSPDAWHIENGYVGSVKCCQTFIWDRLKGLKQIVYFTL